MARRHPLEPWLHEPACDELIRTALEAARPFVAWLSKHVGPSGRVASVVVVRVLGRAILGSA